MNYLMLWSKDPLKKSFSLDKDGDLAIGECAQSQNDVKFCIEDNADQALLKIKGGEKGIKVDKDGNFIAGNINVTADDFNCPTTSRWTRSFQG